MKICAHCSEAITAGQMFRTVDQFRQSGPGIPLRYHLACLRQATGRRRA